MSGLKIKTSYPHTPSPTITAGEGVYTGIWKIGNGVCVIFCMLLKTITKTFC